MPAAATKPPTQRKRNRKRKRRAASTSSSSSDSSAEDSAEDEAPAPKTTKITLPSQPQPEPESSSSDSDSSESSSSDEEDTAARGRQPQNVTPKTPRQFSQSPPPPSAVLPSFLPSENARDDAESKEKELKDRFRQFWMTSVADGFKDDLEGIRKEPNLGTSRLALLINSLAAGADVFSSSSNEKDTINEMDVTLN